MGAVVLQAEVMALHCGPDSYRAFTNNCGPSTVKVEAMEVSEVEGFQSGGAGVWEGQLHGLLASALQA